MRSVVTLNDGREVILRTAEEKDMDDIKQLYYIVYGGEYSLPEVVNRDKMKWAINDPNYMWLLGIDNDQVVSSVVFVTDPLHRLSKAFGAVSHPDYRGKNLVTQMVKEGLQYLMEEVNVTDVVYAVVRTISFAPQIVLEKLGFLSLGVFPNVHKVKRYETHGLKALFKPQALAARKKGFVIIPPVNEIYKITRKTLGLEEPLMLDVSLVDEPREDKREFLIERSRDVEQEFYQKRAKGELYFAFYPFHYPHIKLYTRDYKCEVYISIEDKDGYACLLGIKSSDKITVGLMNRIGEYAESLGIKYLEILVSAFDPEMQKRVYLAKFLPCAYFPALAKEYENRIDYIAFARSFVSIDFSGLKLTDKSKPYLLAFYKIYTSHLLEEIEENV